MKDWTSVRVERATLDDLNEEKRDGESHDDLLNRLLDTVEQEEQVAD